MRFAVHAGCVSRPKLLPTTYHPLPSGFVASGVVRRCPVLAPVVVSTSEGSSPPLEMNLPPETRCRNRSMCGTTFGPTFMKVLLPAILTTACPSLLSRRTTGSSIEPDLTRRQVRSCHGHERGASRSARAAQPDHQGGDVRGRDTSR